MATKINDPFGWFLDRENQWLCDIRNQDMPTDARAGYRVYLGPCEPAITMPWEERLRLAGWTRLGE